MAAKRTTPRRTPPPVPRRAPAPAESPPQAPDADLRSAVVRRVERWLHTALNRMSDAEVLKAVEAQTAAETMAIILVATPEPRPAAEHDWAEFLLRGVAAKRQIIEMVGGLLTSSEAATVLNVSVPGVKQRMERRKVLAVELPGGQWGFPAAQFNKDGHVLPGVPEVLRAVEDTEMEPWILLSILVSPAAGHPGMLLQHLDDPAVMTDMMNRILTYGHHGAA